jgi:hypothetical protein
VAYDRPQAFSPLPFCEEIAKWQQVAGDPQRSAGLRIRRHADHERHRDQRPPAQGNLDRGDHPLLDDCALLKGRINAIERSQQQGVGSNGDMGQEKASQRIAQDLMAGHRDQNICQGLLSLCIPQFPLHHSGCSLEGHIGPGRHHIFDQHLAADIQPSCLYHSVFGV